MGRREAYPFQDSSSNGAVGNGNEWERNYGNTIVQAFLEESERDEERLGEIGKLSGGALDYAVVWSIISDLHLPLSDIEAEWTFARMNSYRAYKQMCSDYSSAWQKYYQKQSEDRNGNR